MQRRVTFTLAAALAVAPGALLAQGQDDVRRETFRLRDTNNDRRLTVQEYGGHPGNFAALDENNDRYLSEDEFVFRRGRGAQRLPQPEDILEARESENVIFRSLDRNRDGAITRGEWTGSAEAFAAFDRNNDQRITRAEHEAGVRGQADFSTLAARYMQRDTNRDGRLSANEWRSDEGLAFARADANNDRAVSLYEYVYRPVTRADQRDDRRDDRREEVFERLDRNNNGRIEANEWTRTKADFARLDADNNGVISKAEYQTPLRANTPAGRFQELDRNNDGALTRSEWRFEPVYFERLDRNDDGVIRQDEFVAGVTNEPSDLAFEQADRNNDGVLSRGEWRNDQVAFHVADRNGDGVVTLREFRNLPKGTVREALFDQLDRDNNNVLLRAEWATNAGGTFEQADRNRDGAVTLWEFLNVAATQPAEETFDDQDHNNDGVISRTEWHGTAWEFDRLDTNDDRVVTLREYYAARPGAPTAMSREERFRALDKDRDGYVSRTEWIGDAESFAILDTVRDGRISAFEFSNTRRLTERFGWLDQNDDGRLGRDEWPGNATSFSQVDTNRDGAVTRDEFLL